MLSLYKLKIFLEKKAKIRLALAGLALLAGLSICTFSLNAYAGSSHHHHHHHQINDSSKDLEITSDRLDYCLKLDRLLTHKLLNPHSVPVGVMEDAHQLQSRGLELCTQGHIRAGIERLRRGLVLLKKYRN